MPIRETPSITETDRALRLFTDRLAERRLFTRYLHADPPPERLLFFHGDGGNGKSLLLKRLATGYCRRLVPADWQRLDAIADDAAFIAGHAAAGEAAEVPYLYHDLGAQDSGEDRPREDWSALMMLRRGLGAHQLKLPLFDYAVMLFLRQRGQLSPERLTALFPQEEADFAASLIDLLTTSSTVSLATKVIGLFGKHLKTDAALWLAKRGLDEARLRTLQAMDPGSELRDQLPRILGEDLNAAMQLPGAPPRLVLLFDTHEAFWGTERHLQSTDSYFQRDEWLRVLLAELYRPNPGIVVVVAGREPPRWAEAPETPIPRDLIDTQLVGHLDRPDAQDYLIRALEPTTGPTPPPDQAALRAALIRCAEVEPSQVHPLYLGLAADVVQQAHARGETLTADDFAAGPDEAPADGPADLMADKGRTLATRLLRYCPEELAYAVKALAAARRFDAGLFYDLGERLHFHATAPAFQTLTGFSFCWREPQPGRGGYRIHEPERRMTSPPATTRVSAYANSPIWRSPAATQPPPVPRSGRPRRSWTAPSTWPRTTRRSPPRPPWSSACSANIARHPEPAYWDIHESIREPILWP